MDVTQFSLSHLNSTDISSTISEATVLACIPRLGDRLRISLGSRADNIQFASHPLSSMRICDQRQVACERIQHAVVVLILDKA